MKVIGFSVSLILVSVLCALPSSGSAQPMRQIDQADHVTFCRTGGVASRVRSRRGCSEDPEAEASADQTTLSLEVEQNLTIDLSRLESRSCSAVIDLGYYQRNTMAHLEGTLENDDCAASSGRYVIFARIRTAAGETQTLEFEEQWQRSGDESIALEADYPIGKNVELLRLSTRRLTCECEE